MSLAYSMVQEKPGFSHDPHITKEIFEEGVSFLNQYLGGVALGNNIPFNPSRDSEELETHEFPIPKEANGILITKRKIIHPDGLRRRRTNQITISGFHDRYPYSISPGSLTVTTTSGESISSETDLGSTIGALKHELGHHLGLGHCASLQCIMKPRSTDEESYRFSVIKQPFCRGHLEQIDSILSSKPSV